MPQETRCRMESNHRDKHRTVIEAGRNWSHYWLDIWCYRDLLFYLSWRDVLVRYKQTVIGLTWSILRPFMTMVIFTIIFGKLAKFPLEGSAPYPVLVFSALLSWQLFANTLNETSNSIVRNSAMISKVYFPRLIIPASTIIVGLVDFLIAFFLFILIMVWYQHIPDWRILTLPLFIALAIATSFGAGLWMSALNVRYRDIRHIAPFLVQFGLFISPVGYSSSLIPDKWRLLYSINPMVGVIDGFRWAILGGESNIYIPGLFLSVGLTFLLMWSGLRYFRKVEKTFADMI